jgi:HPt (histidine-containing phosphotransfer) domain-containing protein
VGVVDEAILSELFRVIGDADPSSLRQTCDLFLTNAPTRMADAAVALADGRFADAGRLAHRMKGSAGVFGACRLSGLADRLEHACDDADVGSGGSLLEQMTVELAAFGTILRARLVSLPSG